MFPYYVNFGRHRSENHNDVCRSTKWMMLHARDCPGTTVTSDICPFPWCRKVKHFLYHLVSCETPSECPICSPVSSNANMRRLSALNAFRIEKRRSFFCQRVATLREAQNLSTDTPEDRFSPLKHCEPCKTSSSRGTDNLTVHPSLVTASSTEPSIPSLNAINTIDAVTSEKCQIIDKYVDSVAAAQRQTLPLEVALSVVNDKSQFAMVATLDKPHEGIILTSTPHTLVSNTVSNSVCKQESLQGSVCTRMLLDTEAAIAQVPTSHSVKKDTDLLPEVVGTFPSAHLTLPSTTDQPATQNDSSTLSAFSEGDHARLTVLSTSDQPSKQNVSSTISVFSKGDHSGTITNSLPSSSSTKASVVRCLDAVDIMVPESAPAAITYIKLESVTSDSINIVEKVQGALIINSEVAEVSSIPSILLSTTEIEENKLQSQCSELGNSSTQVSEKIVVDTMVPLQDLNLTVLVDNTEVILHAGIVKLENENETEAIPEKNSVSILSQISVQDDANIKSDTLFVPIEDPLSSIVKEEQTLSKVDATLDEVPDEQRTLHCLSSPGKDNVDIGAITNTIEKPNVSEFKTEQSTIRNDRVSNENLILRVQ